MNQPIKSPIQAKMGSPLFLVKLAADLLKVHKDFLAKVDVVGDILRETKTERERILKLPPGEKGEKGDSIVGPQGIQGRPGTPGKDAEVDLETIVNTAAKKVVMRIDTAEIASIAAGLITQPKDGETPALDAVVAAVIEELKIEDRFNGISNEIASYRNQLAGKIYGKDTWARGGGTTVSQGSNITLVPLADGTVQINASGGGSGTNVVTQYALTAVQSGSDVTIDLTQLTHWASFVNLVALYRNNQVQTQGTAYDFTITGSTITVFNASAGDIFNTTYAYA